MTTYKSGRFKGKWKGRAVVNFDVAEAILETDIPAKIKLRTFVQSKDIYGQDFIGYSRKGGDNSYYKQREAMGEIASRVTLHLTGGLLGSIGAWSEAKRTRAATSIIISAKATASRIVAPSESSGHYKETGKFGPPHNQVLYWLGPGNKRGRKRIIMGLTPKERKSIAKTLAKNKGFIKIKSVRDRK